MSPDLIEDVILLVFAFEDQDHQLLDAPVVQLIPCDADLLVLLVLRGVAIDRFVYFFWAPGQIPKVYHDAWQLFLNVRQQLRFEDACRHVFRQSVVVTGGYRESLFCPFGYFEVDGAPDLCSRVRIRYCSSGTSATSVTLEVRLGSPGREEGYLRK